MSRSLKFNGVMNHPCILLIHCLRFYNDGIIMRTITSDNGTCDILDEMLIRVYISYIRLAVFWLVGIFSSNIRRDFFPENIFDRSLAKATVKTRFYVLMSRKLIVENHTVRKKK